MSPIYEYVKDIKDYDEKHRMLMNLLMSERDIESMCELMDQCISFSETAKGYSQTDYRKENKQ